MRSLKGVCNPFHFKQYNFWFKNCKFVNYYKTQDYKHKEEEHKEEEEERCKKIMEQRSRKTMEVG